jgi:uncharacterized protein YcsI (UPF0317 family)
MLDIIVPVSPRTNGCPEKSGAVQPLPDGLVPVFWACGVTPQAAAEAARPPLMIAHAPAHSFITDVPAETLMA